MYGPIDEILLKSKEYVRKDCLARIDKMVKSNYSNALIPRLRVKPNKYPQEHLHEAFTHIYPEPDSQDQYKIKQNLNLVKTIVSDFEEVLERGRFLKYDNMLERSEIVFTRKKQDLKK